MEYLHSINGPIGYVVADENISCIPPFIKAVKDTPTTELPVLFVGKRKVESEYPNTKISVLDRTLAPNRFWTWSQEEYLYFHFKDLSRFVSHCLNEYDADFGRYYLDESGEEYREWQRYLKKKYPWYGEQV